jgi:hypothetical protein
MPSSKIRFLTLLRIGLICLLINGIFLYVVIKFIIIPCLDRGISFEEFGQMLHEKQTSSLVPYTQSKLPFL